MTETGSVGSGQVLGCAILTDFGMGLLGRGRVNIPPVNSICIRPALRNRGARFMSFPGMLVMPTESEPSLIKSAKHVSQIKTEGTSACYLRLASQFLFRSVISSCLTHTWS